MTDTQNPRMFYGWKIVIAIMSLLTFTSGLSFYNHSIYLNSLAENPAFTVQSASMAVSLFFLTGGVAGLWVAKWVQDYDPRICICAGSVISFVSLVALAGVQNNWQLYLVYSLFGVGFSASSLIPATTLVTRWFQKRRAMALSIASTGLSLGGVIITPLCVILVERVSFNTAAPIMGAIYLLVVPIAWIWLRAGPESMGLHPDGEEREVVEDENKSEEVDVPRSHSDVDGITFAEAKKGRFFWGVSLAYIFLMMAQVGGISHQYGLARELLTESQTALAVAILPVGSIVGRLIGGWIVDQVSIRMFTIGMMCLQAMSLCLLAMGFSALTLCLGLALFGVTVGNLLMLQPLIIADAFGLREYPKIFSVANLMSSWGTAAGPALLGLVYGLNANLYSLSYFVAAAAGAIGLVLFVVGGKYGD